jgi:hypothetical protein
MPFIVRGARFNLLLDRRPNRAFLQQHQGNAGAGQ